MNVLARVLKAVDILGFVVIGLSVLGWIILSIVLWFHYKRKHQIGLKGIVISFFIMLNVTFILLLVSWTIAELAKLDQGTHIKLTRKILFSFFVPLMVFNFIIMMLWIFIPDRLDPNSWKVLWKIRRGIESLQEVQPSYKTRRRKPKKVKRSKVSPEAEPQTSSYDAEAERIRQEEIRQEQLRQEQLKREEALLREQQITADRLKKEREAEIKAERDAALKAQKEREAQMEAAKKARNRAEQARIKQEQREAKRRDKERKAAILQQQKEAQVQAKAAEARRKQLIEEQRNRAIEAERQKRRREEEIRKSQEAIRKAQEERKKAQAAKRAKGTSKANNDYLYRCLGLRYPASDEAIKKAYRILAKRYHPDLSKDPNAEKKFMIVQKAYDVLSNKARKMLYDKEGKY